MALKALKLRHQGRRSLKGMTKLGVNGAILATEHGEGVHMSYLGLEPVGVMPDARLTVTYPATECHHSSYSVTCAQGCVNGNE